MIIQNASELQSTPKLIVSNQCNQVIRGETDYTIMNDGEILNVRVELKNVCPCSTLMVGVVIYKENVLYAHKVKRICTNNCYIENYYYCQRPRGGISPFKRRLSPRYVLRQDICIDGFEFLFLDCNCEEHRICICSYAHYIY